MNTAQYPETADNILLLPLNKILEDTHNGPESGPGNE